MLTIKVSWNNADFLNYHVYQAKEYCVCAIDDGTVSLLLDGQTNITLFEGNKVYIMNDNGATVDTIYVPKTKIPAVVSNPRLSGATPNLWVDPATGRTEERIGY